MLNFNKKYVVFSVLFLMLLAAGYLAADTCYKKTKVCTDVTCIADVQDGCSAVSGRNQLDTNSGFSKPTGFGTGSASCGTATGNKNNNCSSYDTVTSCGTKTAQSKSNCEPCDSSK